MGSADLVGGESKRKNRHLGLRGTHRRRPRLDLPMEMVSVLEQYIQAVLYEMVLALFLSKSLIGF